MQRLHGRYKRNYNERIAVPALAYTLASTVYFSHLRAPAQLVRRHNENSCGTRLSRSAIIGGTGVTCNVNFPMCPAASQRRVIHDRSIISR